MVSVLRRTSTRLQRLAAQFGQSTGIAEWAARIYTATWGGLACPFGRRTGTPDPGLNGGGWRWMDTDELRGWLDGQVAVFCRAHGLDERAGR